MADAVNTTVVYESPRYYVVQFTNTSDGTGESDVTKVDVSTLTGPSGETCVDVVLEEITWSIKGFAYVAMEWDADTDDVLETLAGDGYKSYEFVAGLHNPKSTGWNGDVLITTGGAVADSIYNIVCTFRKR